MGSALGLMCTCALEYSGSLALGLMGTWELGSWALEKSVSKIWRAAIC
jgi:hypothetical protein